MSEEKISISTADLTDVPVSEPEQAAPAERRGRIGRALIAPLTLMLPVLCITGWIVLFFIRNHDLPQRYVWTRYLLTLLIVSGLLTTGFAVVATLLTGNARIAANVDSHVLDSIAAFPAVEPSQTHTTEELANSFRKTIFIVGRAPKWRELNRENLAETGFGSGVLVFAGRGGYLLLSSRHVIDGVNWQQAHPYDGKIAIGPEEGDFTFGRVVGRHRTLDLILIGIERKAGATAFTQPIAEYANVPIGERIFVFGHPEGFFFSVSDGIVSRKDAARGLIQMTAPVSPGASGGPVFDLHGRLVGIVTAMIDKRIIPMSENLNFAVRADSLLRVDDWSLNAMGAALLTDFIIAHTPNKTAPAPPSHSPTPPVKPKSK